MSVLYQALIKAARSRQSIESEEPQSPSAVPIYPSSRSRRRFRFSPVAAVVVTAGTMSLAGLLFFGGEIVGTVEQIISPDSKLVPAPRTVAQTAPAAPKSPAAPVVTQAPSTVATALPQNGDTAAVQPVPVPSPAPAPSPAATPLPAGGSVSALADPAGAAGARQTAAGPTSAVPPPSHRPGPPSDKGISADEDLPAILDRIKRQKTSGVLGGTAEVGHDSSPMNSMTVEGESVVSVADPLPQGRDDIELAYALARRGLYAEALERYSFALKKGPDNVQALLGRATMQQRLGRLADAQSGYRRVLAVDSDNREALTNLMGILAGQNPDQALVELRGLQRANPAFSPVAAGIGEIEARHGNLPEALAQLGKAVALSPDNGLYRLNLAILQDRAGMPMDAVASYQAALAMFDGNTSLPVPVDQVRERIQFLRQR